MKKNYLFTLLLTFCFSVISFGQVLITELADPNNDAAARYVEIYNAGTSAQDMTGWTLQRYTNGNSGLSTNVVDLAPIGSLAAGSFAIIAANATNFQTAPTPCSLKMSIFLTETDHELIFASYWSMTK